MSDLHRSALSGLALLLSGCGHPARVVLAEADDAYRRGDFERAAAAYAGLPFFAGEQFRAYGAFRAATCWRDALHDPRRAELQFQDCARSHAETSWGYACMVELGNLRRDRWDLRGAVDAYRGALQMQPQGEFTEHILLESGRLYLRLGEAAPAREEWAELLQRVPQTTRRADVATEWARSWEIEGDARAALIAWEDILRAEPDASSQERALLGRAEALAAMGDFAQAEAAFERALAASSQPDAVLLLLNALREREARREGGTLGRLNEVLAAKSGHGGEKDDGADLPPLPEDGASAAPTPEDSREEPQQPSPTDGPDESGGEPEPSPSAP